MGIYYRKSGSQEMLTDAVDDAEEIGVYNIIERQVPSMHFSSSLPRPLLLPPCLVQSPLAP